MNKEEAKIINETMQKMDKEAAVTVLGYIKAGYEAFKKLEIPNISPDGMYCFGIKMPYKENKDVRTFVDFMITYLDEGIKGIKKNMKEEVQNNGRSI